MAVSIPPQRRACATYDWCTGPGRRHRSHVGEIHVVDTSRGTQMRVSLRAEDADEPLVDVEVAFERDGPSMEVAELEAAEAVELAGVFLRLARVARGAQGADNGIR